MDHVNINYLRGYLAANIHYMRTAHGIGLGSGPVTSFSKEAVRVILNLPSNLNPEMLLCIGYAAPKSESQLIMRPKKRVT